MHIWHDSLKATREMYKSLPKGRKYQKKDDLPEEDVSINMYNHGWIINYAAMLDDMDRALGTLLDSIDRLGIAGNTYVILTSDNGGGFGEMPLKGGKGSLYEGGNPDASVCPRPGESNVVPIQKFRWCSGTFCKLSTTLLGERNPFPQNLMAVASGISLKKGRREPLGGIPKASFSTFRGTQASLNL